MFKLTRKSPVQERLDKVARKPHNVIYFAPRMSGPEMRELLSKRIAEVPETRHGYTRPEHDCN